VPKLLRESEFEWWRAGFSVSKRDNLWRHYEGLVLTVFAWNDLYGWLISNEATGEKSYSSRKWGGEQEAMIDLWRELKERGC
jgi:hypothetical protein